MQHLVANFEQHAVWVVFFHILLTQIGVPLPVVPTLMTAAALAGQGTYPIAEVVAAGLGGAMLGDNVPYWLGRRYGREVLSVACRMSLSPDFCVLRTETLFAKVGAWTLLFAKFIPGFSLISVVMAGATRMSLPAFLVVDGIGKLLFVSVAVALGRIFRHAIADALAVLRELGEYGGLLVIAALALYLMAKWVRRQLFIRQLRMDRITVDELRRLIDAREDIVILDVRPEYIRAEAGMIAGAVGAHPDDVDTFLADRPGEAEVVIYCDCPNETSAAIAARHLKRAGFKKIRPLLGGIDAWVDAGHPIQRVLPAGAEVQDIPTTEANKLALDCSQAA
jgi:membrane protein DedA with SNARE-associated domain/rhodanese-related sulfurtransferase